MSSTGLSASSAATRSPGCSAAAPTATWTASGASACLQPGYLSEMIAEHHAVVAAARRGRQPRSPGGDAPSPADGPLEHPQPARKPSRLLRGGVTGAILISISFPTVPYHPPQEILERYAERARRLRPRRRRGDTAGRGRARGRARGAKPLYVRAAARRLARRRPRDRRTTSPTTTSSDNLSRDFFELADDEQLDFFPASYMRGLIDEIDHQVTVISDTDLHALEGIDPARIMRHGRGDEAAARLAHARRRTRAASPGRSASTARRRWRPRRASPRQEYWEQIIHACFLDEPDPIARWREVGDADQRLRERLDALPIERLHVAGEDVDLWISARRAPPLGRRQRAQHPELRDLHEPRLARHRGLDRASTSRSTATATSCSGIRLEFARRARRRGERRAERAACSPR